MKIDCKYCKEDIFQLINIFVTHKHKFICEFKCNNKLCNKQIKIRIGSKEWNNVRLLFVEIRYIIQKLNRITDNITIEKNNAIASIKNESNI